MSLPLSSPQDFGCLVHLTSWVETAIHGAGTLLARHSSGALHLGDRDFELGAKIAIGVAF